MRRRLPVILLCATLAAGVAMRAHAAEVEPTSAIGYENDYDGCGSAPVQQDVLTEVGALDGVFAPRIEPCVLVDYFATGRSQGYLDAVSLRFTLSPAPPSSSRSFRMRVYLKKGTYSDGSWHAMRLYPGSFSAADEDCDSPAACWSAQDEFPSDAGWEGWVDRPVPSGWVVGSQLECSLRLWNAKVDAVTLVVTDGSSSGSTLQSAVGFEDDYGGCGPGPTTQDVLAEVAAQDGVFSPRVEGCVSVNYFANGGSQGWLDGISAHFDLGEYGAQLAHAALTLRAYVRMGDYSASWHALKIYPGAFNPQDEACDSYRACWTAQDEFPGTAGWEGWVERPVPLEWLASSQLDLTIRFWTARVDAIELAVDGATQGRQATWGELKRHYLK